VGKPNEREREILLFSYKKVQNSSKTTFPAKENTSHHQICPTEICLVFGAKIVLLYSLLHTSFSVPTVNCTDCSVRPRNSHQNSKIRLKNRAQMPLFPCQICTVVWIVQTIQIRTVRPPTAKKKFGRKLTEIFFLGFVPCFLGKRALFVAHFPLSSILRKYI
jgi:hypothetical protein